jgi:L-alanine-DL-glutamate epimerase-like enolase superfamily enzyme
LTISRGSSAGSKSFVVELESDGIVGIGEAAEFEIPDHGEDSNRILNDLEKSAVLLRDLHPTQRHQIESTLITAGIGSSTRAAIDMATYDWAGKSTQQPVWKLLGLEPTPRGPISVTIGNQ